MAVRAVFENEPVAFPAEDVVALQARLGGLLERRERGWAVCRVVGQIALPSGDTLVISSRKASSASVLAWAAYADPTLAALRALGRLPASAREGELTTVTARLFLEALLEASARSGLVRSYQRVERRTSAVRGAIDFGRLARQGGVLSRLPCLVWERLADTPLNRLLAAAVDVVARLPHARQACSALLAPARSMFDGVKRTVDPTLLSGGRSLGRLERAYELPLALARLLLRSSGLRTGEDATGPSFLVNLDDLFERAVAMAFRESAIESRAKAPAPYRKGASYAESVPRSLQMDVFLPDAGDGPVVVDAKYKSAISPGNLQQMVTYCHLTGAARAVLVVPGGVVADTESYFFPSPTHGTPITVDVVELATDGEDLAAWRRAAGEMVRQALPARSAPEPSGTTPERSPFANFA